MEKFILLLFIFSLLNGVEGCKKINYFKTIIKLLMNFSPVGGFGVASAMITFIFFVLAIIVVSCFCIQIYHNNSKSKQKPKKAEKQQQQEQQQPIQPKF